MKKYIIALALFVPAIAGATYDEAITEPEATTTPAIVEITESVPDVIKPKMSSGGSTPCYILQRAYGLTECDNKSDLAMKYAHEVGYHFEVLKLFWSNFFR